MQRTNSRQPDVAWFRAASFQSVLATALVAFAPATAAASDFSSLAPLVVVGAGGALLFMALVALLHRYVAFALCALSVLPVGYAAVVVLFSLANGNIVSTLFFYLSLAVYVRALAWRLLRDD
jgi:hypothetical protein